MLRQGNTNVITVFHVQKQRLAGSGDHHAGVELGAYIESIEVK